ncbi:alpha/beta fold hydrolase [Variovorax sp. E3]|uniref:alpha/beta fold hydrolase n=1 Tax=Variovorax sp. E3 TaxID=1914993 RepID=UPI0018DBF49F|nr:alpha/beta hydrolase [Variovorax sp. E3]
MNPIAVRLRKAAQAALRDAEFQAACSGLGATVEAVVLGDGAEPTTVHMGGAERVRLSAAPDIWEYIAQPIPRPGWHSFAAASRQPGFTVEADAVARAQALHAIERWFEILRGQIDAGAQDFIDRQHLTGSYALVRGLTGGRAVSLFHESVSRTDAPALLMLHTAGADGRQYHALMADKKLQRHWSLHAFDMPGHGRSDPLPGEGWEGYRLRRDWYAEICVAFVAQVLRRPVVVMGCSMGAAMALHLAREAPEWILGAVALEAPLRSPGRRTPLLAHAQVNQAAHNPSYVRGLLAPGSPLSHRRYAAWIYSQGGYGIYPGDLAFYSDDFDAERDVAGLDGRERPIELLTGSYDHSATPADSRAVARMIPGARFTEMPELGHFPMTENPAALLRHLHPALTHIAGRLA